MKVYTNWYFMGDPQQRVFATKIEAEAAARVAYPDEHPDTRYARVFCKKIEFVLNPQGRLDDEGEAIPAWGFESKDMFITDPYTSECGRFTVRPGYHRLTEEQARELVGLNADLNR